MSVTTQTRLDSRSISVCLLSTRVNACLRLNLSGVKATFRCSRLLCYMWCLVHSVFSAVVQ